MKKAKALPEISGGISENSFDGNKDYFNLEYMCPYCGLGCTISFGCVDEECYLLESANINNECDCCGATLTIEITEPKIELKEADKLRKRKIIKGQDN